ncbi:PREDICTED: uncharacterized protein LOC104817174 [Tarenaya hassleriana]|uniref:uncharacterized protein LOC104817174 n=1 Tax=Tarenaya hassleriana TaxID=28532 RepID=UPI00053C2CF4|nr:PREDICTED: uncharacterized protein LOC104817174 [Tarenaya hassleriana]
MRCKRHVADLSSSVGVCASCLRERLLSLAVSVAAADSAGDHRHFLRPVPPPLAFPRSVSPYVAPRKSDAGHYPLSSHRRFFFTPQVGPGPSSSGGGGSEAYRSLRKKRNGFSRLYNLFRARSDEFDSGFKSSVSDPRLSYASMSSSMSWFSTVISGRIKKQPASCFIEDMISDGDRRPRKVFCRGMSPERDTEMEDEREPPAWASVEESPGKVKRTPAAEAAETPTRRKTRAGLAKSLSGMVFCLSPLVRASPSRHWKGKGNLPPEFGFSGECKPHISTASSFCANRSRKLVDLGRANHRR